MTSFITQMFVCYLNKKQFTAVNILLVLKEFVKIMINFKKFNK